jgi:Ca2+/Na+ antiporter
MTTAIDYPAARFGGLVASEARRLWHRRVVRWLFLAAALIYVFVIVIVFFHHAKNGINHPKFLLDQTARDGAIGVGVGTSILMFVVGATYAGAEWTQRTIVALLFWEPRRGRVIGAKVLVAALAATVVTVLTQVIWLLTAFFLAATEGDSTRPSKFWSDLLAREFRVLIFMILIAWLGFGIANLVRHSAASLGVGFVYFVILENVVQAYWHWARQWLLTYNAGALLTPGGIDIPNENSDSTQQHLSNLHGGLVWAVFSGVVLLIGGALFARRDAT